MKKGVNLSKEARFDIPDLTFIQYSRGYPRIQGIFCGGQCVGCSKGSGRRPCQCLPWFGLVDIGAITQGVRDNWYKTFQALGEVYVTIRDQNRLCLGGSSIYVAVEWLLWDWGIRGVGGRQWGKYVRRFISWGWEEYAIHLGVWQFWTNVHFYPKYIKLSVYKGEYCNKIYIVVMRKLSYYIYRRMCVCTLVVGEEGGVWSMWPVICNMYWGGAGVTTKGW